MKAYTFLITPQGNKGVYRVLRIGGNYTLNDLHLQILKAFDFSADHLYMFSLNGRPYEAGGYYSPYTDSGINAEMVMLDELKLVKMQKLLYLYDFGDDWMFDIVVKDIEAVSRATFPKVLEKKGELVQYPIWDDEEDWGEYMLEDPLSFHGDLFGMEDSDEDIAVEFDENMRSMEDIIAEWENNDLQVALNYLNVKVQGKKGGKRAKARAIAAELKQNPYKLTCLVPAGGILALLELVKNQSISMLDCLMNHDSMAMLDRLGLVDLEELPGGIIYYSAAAKKIIAYFEKGSRRTELEEKAGIETRIKSLLQIYGIIEQKELWNHMSNYLDREMQEMEFAYIYIFPSLMSGELSVFSGETAWITVFDEPENIIVLQNRKERSPRNYRNITADELDAYMQNGIAAFVPAYEDLESYFLEKELSFEGYLILQEVLAKCAALLGEWKDIEEIVREILNEDGLRLTKKVSAMIVKVLEEYPSASLKGYSRNYSF